MIVISIWHHRQTWLFVNTAVRHAEFKPAIYIYRCWLPQYWVFGHTIFKQPFFYIHCPLALACKSFVWSFVEFWAVLKLCPTKSCAIFWPPDIYYDWKSLSFIYMYIHLHIRMYQDLLHSNKRLVIMTGFRFFRTGFRWLTNILLLKNSMIFKSWGMIIRWVNDQSPAECFGIIDSRVRQIFFRLYQVLTNPLSKVGKLEKLYRNTSPVRHLPIRWITPPKYKNVSPIRYHALSSNAFPFPLIALWKLDVSQPFCPITNM